jgi:hypothetical protein
MGKNRKAQSAAQSISSPSPRGSASLCENQPGSSSRPLSDELRSRPSARRAHRDRWRAPLRLQLRGRCQSLGCNAENLLLHSGPDRPQSDSLRSDGQPRSAGPASEGRSKACMEFLGPLPCFVVTLAEIQHDFPHIRFGPGNELRVPPPEATVEIPHGTPGHLHHLRGDGSMICHRCGGLGVHKATLARSNRRLKHPNSTVGTHLGRRHTHPHSSSRAVHAEIRASSRPPSHAQIDLHPHRPLGRWSENWGPLHPFSCSPGGGF